MKFKQLLLLVLFFVFCISLNVFADDLKIEDGKNLKFEFKGYNDYDDQQVYDNVTIGAGTKVVLDSQWQYVYISSDTATTYTDGVKYDTTTVPVSSSSVINSVETTTYKYRNDENIATLSIAKDGVLTLNSGSELSLRNQYSLITSTQDVSLKYSIVGKDDEGQDIIVLTEANTSNMKYTESEGYNDCTNYNGTYNRNIIDSADIFTGDIKFGEGIVDTVLTFQQVATSSAKKNGILPIVKESVIVPGKGVTGTTTETDSIVDISEGKPTEEYTSFINNFQIDSNRAVFNVLGDVYFTGKEYTMDASSNSFISGNGTVVKAGAGTLYLLSEMDLSGQEKYVDSTGLTGSNTGYAWSIEDGILAAARQENLGTGNIYIDTKGSLALLTMSGDFANNITSNSGGIIIRDGISSLKPTNIGLSGDITGNAVNFSMLGYSNVTLTGTNTVDNFSIYFSGAKNNLILNISNLADQSVSAYNVTKEATDKEFSNFTLVIDQDSDVEYKGSLNGEMYVTKTGTGTLTLSGTNTYTEGTYISEGSILMTNASSLGTGKIWFDSGVRGSSSTYASIGVSSLTVGTIDLLNNIHIDEGAVFNVYEGQQISLQGDVSRYNTSTGYETEFVKTGLGLLEIAKSSSTIRKVNMSTFTVQEGGFNLDENVVLNSYFSLNSDSAYLSMENGAGVKNTIDIDAGDLIIFNDSNISTATVNFNSTSTVTLSQLHITSNTVLSTATLQNPITVTKGIDFVIDATTTANLNAFNFVSTNDSIIEKSGNGDLNFNTNNTNFTLSNLTVDGGYFNLVSNSSMTVSSTTIVDGGFLSFEQGSFFQSSASGIDEKIVVSSGGIKIYDDNNIEGSTLLSFEGTDPNNLAKLIVEADNVNLTNSIFVKTGVIVENEKNLTISGDSINYDSTSSGIFAKSGAGTMTIAQTSGGAGFDMGQIAVLEGLMNVTTDVNVSTVVVTGYTSSMNISNSTMTVVNDFDLFDYDNLLLSSAKLSVGNDLSISSGSFSINNSTVTVANKLDMLDMALFSVAGSSVTAQSLIGENIADDISISTSNVIVSSSMTLTDFSALDVFNSRLTVGTDLALSSGSFTVNNSTVSVVNSLNMDDLELFSIARSSFTAQSLIVENIANDISISTSNVIVSSSMALTNFSGLDVFNSRLTVGTDLALSSGSFTVENSTVSVVNNLDMSNLDLFAVRESSLTAKELISADVTGVEISASNVIVSSGMALSNFESLDIVNSDLTVGSNFDLFNGTATFTNSNLFVGKDLTFSDSIFEISTTSLNISSNAYFTRSNLIISSSSISSDYMSVYKSSITLRNESVLAADVELDTDSILNGFGSVNGALHVNSDAGVSIGETSSQLGQMSANSVKFNSGSTLYVDVKSSNSVTSNDQLEVLGDVTVETGVTLDVNIIGDNSEFNRKKSFEIITYTGVLDPLNVAIFDNIILSSARLKADVESVGNSIFLNIFQRWSSYTLPKPTTNQQVMMDTLNNISDDSAESLIFDATLSKMDELYGDYQDTGNSVPFITAMADLSGLMYANSFQSSALLANSKINMTYNRLIDFEDREQNNIWAQVYTNTQSIEKNEDNSKFENNVSGLIAGFDTFTTEDFIVGISGFYGTGQFKQLEDKADINDAGVNAYAYYQYDDIEIKGLMGYGIQNYEATRKIRFINQEIKSNYSVNVLNFDIEAAYRYSLNNTMVLKPLVGLNCTVTSNDQIVEDGNLEQKLSIDSGHYTKADFRVGIGLQSNNSSKFNWYVSAIAKQIIDGDKLTMTASFAAIPDEKFEIESTKLSDTVFSGNIGGLYSLTKSINLFIDLSSDTSSSTNMLSGNVGASYRW